jgi:hypothetical protein
VAAERFLEFMYAPDWKQRVRQSRGALGALFRKNRI